MTTEPNRPNPARVSGFFIMEKTMNLKKYSKAIGAAVGGVIGFLVSLGILPNTIDANQLVGNIDTLLIALTAIMTTVSGIIGAFSAPKNAD